MVLEQCLHTKHVSIVELEKKKKDNQVWEPETEITEQKTRGGLAKHMKNSRYLHMDVSSERCSVKSDSLQPHGL